MFLVRPAYVPKRGCSGRRKEEKDLQSCFLQRRCGHKQAFPDVVVAKYQPTIPFLRGVIERKVTESAIGQATRDVGTARGSAEMGLD